MNGTTLGAAGRFRLARRPCVPLSAGEKLVEAVRYLFRKHASAAGARSVVVARNGKTRGNVARAHRVYPRGEPA